MKISEILKAGPSFSFEFFPPRDEKMEGVLAQTLRDLEPVRRQLLKGLRVGSLLGIALGVASTGAGTASTFRQPGWAASLVLLTSAGTVLGAAFGVCSGLVTRWSQRRRLDRDLATLVAEQPS